MQAIDVDFEVYKQLTMRRETEHVTYNDVLRALLGLDSTHTSPANEQTELNSPSSGKGDWVVKGVTFPEGTEFRATYKGQLYQGVVSNGGLMVNGNSYTSPSAAAKAITNGPVNGWMFWQCKFPGRPSWEWITLLRR